MLKEQRYMAICDELRRNHFVTSQELSERLGISKSTIRRDLLDLEADGKLTRARGGAILKSPFSTEDPLAVLPETELSEKKRIALAALSYIGVNETILLSSGNTCMELAKVLHQKAPLYVATIDIFCAAELAKDNNIELTIVGGSIRHNHYDVVGYFAESMLRQIHADKVFMGIDAIDMNLGFMNYSSEDVTVNLMMMDASKQTFILCDHTKFHAIAFANLCPFGRADVLITGKEAAEEDIALIRDKGVEVVLV